MFQNISGQVDTEEIEEESKKEKLKYIAHKLFTKQNIILYIISFMISQVPCGQITAPFGLAIFAATCSNGIPSGIVYLMTLLRNMVRVWNKRVIKLHINFSHIYRWFFNRKTKI